MGRGSREKRDHRLPNPRGTTVAVNGVGWRVDATPLDRVWSTGHRATRVARHTADVFLLAPSFGSYLFGWAFVVAGGVTVIAGLAGVVSWVRDGFPAVTRHAPGWVSVLSVALAGVFSWLGLRMLTPTTRFDRRSGRMTRRLFWRTTADRPLIDIVAVQCLYAGRKSAGGPRGPTSWHEYQLNVAVTGAPGARVNVCGEPNGRWIRGTAAALAGFLGVPLVDHFAATGAPDSARRPRRETPRVP